MRHLWEGGEQGNLHSTTNQNREAEDLREKNDQLKESISDLERMAELANATFGTNVCANCPLLRKQIDDLKAGIVSENDKSGVAKEEARSKKRERRERTQAVAGLEDELASPHGFERKLSWRIPRTLAVSK